MVLQCVLTSICDIEGYTAISSAGCNSLGEILDFNGVISQHAEGKFGAGKNINPTCDDDCWTRTYEVCGPLDSEGVPISEAFEMRGPRFDNHLDCILGEDCEVFLSGLVSGSFDEDNSIRLTPEVCGYHASPEQQIQGWTDSIKIKPSGADYDTYTFGTGTLAAEGTVETLQICWLKQKSL